MNLTALSAGAAGLLVALASSVVAQQTGLDAFAVLTRDKGSTAGTQVVSLSGRRGAEQPDAWRLVARDPAFAGHFREYVVKAGRVISEHAVPTAESASYATAPLVRAKVKIDSPVVFWRAHTEAKKALVGFDTVDYELRNAEFSTKPVWVVSLIGRGGSKVGEVAVSAESGNVLRRTWFEAGRQTVQRTGTVGTPQRSGTTTALSDKAQQALDGTRTGWNQGKKAVKTGFSKASTTVGGWLLRAGSATAPPPATTPPKRTTR
jgi:hypothetical protein